MRAFSGTLFMQRFGSEAHCIQLLRLLELSTCLYQTDRVASCCRSTLWFPYRARIQPALRTPAQSVVAAHAELRRTEASFAGASPHRDPRLQIDRDETLLRLRCLQPRSDRANSSRRQVWSGAGRRSTTRRLDSRRPREFSPAIQWEPAPDVCPPGKGRLNERRGSKRSAPATMILSNASAAVNQRNAGLQIWACMGEWSRAFPLLHRTRPRLHGIRPELLSLPAGATARIPSRRLPGTQAFWSALHSEAATAPKRYPARVLKRETSST